MANTLPTASTPSLSRAEDRRLLIIETTLRLIAAGGVDAVSHRRVAAAAGVPLGSTTYYFDSREHLLREAFSHYLGKISAAYSELAVPYSERGRPEDMVEFLVELTKRDFADEDMTRAEYELTLFASRDAEIAKELHAHDDRVVAKFAQALESFGAARPFDGARTLVYLVRGYELDRLTRHDLDSDDLRRRLQVVVAAYLGSQRDAPSN